MRSVRVCWPGFRLKSVLMVLLAVVLLDATPAGAKIAASATPIWPPDAKVGDLVTAVLLIANQSFAPDDTEGLELANLSVTPSCAAHNSPICLAGFTDPGVFRVLTAVGDAGTCAGVEFTVQAPDPVTGEVALTPTVPVTLGPGNGPFFARSCVVNLLLRVRAVPGNPAPGEPDFTTFPLARTVLIGLVSGLPGVASGTAKITIEKGDVTLTSTSIPNGVVLAGSAVMDTAVVTKAPGAVPPTGFIRFILCLPTEVTANGCSSPAGSKVGVDIPLVNNGATSIPTGNTAPLGKYCWRARYLGDANYNPLNHTNSTTECFTTH